MPTVPADPTVLHPMPEQPRVVLLKPLITSPLIEVGEFSYYDDPDEPTAFETRNVLYHYGPEKLVIGKFCALGEGVRFIMNGANHRMDGPSTFPFPIMGGSWVEHFDLITGLPARGDTVVGNDVWLGYRSMVMPGVRIGHGAIIASGSVVVDDVPDYGIVGGNPARLIRRRYSDADIERLLAVAWWDWPLQHITEHLRTIMSGSIDELETARRRPRTVDPLAFQHFRVPALRNRAICMPASSHHNPFAGWLHRHAVPLTHLDPAAPLDDLEPLRDIVGDARVVAIGENSHFITEFSLMRRRILRFLAERCGFTVLAFEYGFSEGFPLDAWAQGEGTDHDLSAHLAAAIPVGVDEPLRWIRRHNATAAVPVRFAGIDIPAAGGSLLPALAPVADYLRQVDPEALPAVQTAMRIAGSFAGASAAAAAPAWTRLTSAEQDALSAILMRLLIRFRAVEPLYVSRADQRSYDIALRRLEGACQGDYTFRAMADLYAGSGLTADASARDVYMAGSVLWHLERLGPGTRIVLAAHNAHIQKTPVSFDGHLTGLPMGQHLHNSLGDDYVALALTSITGHTADMRPDENARFGFAIDNTALEPPEPGSVEAAFADAGLGLAVADLRRARHEIPGPDRIRIQSAYVHTPVLDAFDGILNTPASTVADDVQM